MQVLVITMHDGTVVYSGHLAWSNTELTSVRSFIEDSHVTRAIRDWKAKIKQAARGSNDKTFHLRKSDGTISELLYGSINTIVNKKVSISIEG